MLCSKQGVYEPLSTDPEKLYAVVMNNFMAQGGDDNTFLVGRPYVDTGSTLADQFVRYLEAFSPVSCPVDAAQPRITVTFEDPTLPPSSAAPLLHVCALLLILPLLLVFFM